MPLRGLLLQSHNMLGFIFMLAVLIVAPRTGCGKLNLITQDEGCAFSAGCQPDLDIPRLQKHRPGYHQVDF